MVLPDSSRVSRAPPYSGIRFESVRFSLTWLSHSLAGLSRPLQLTYGLVTLLVADPTTPKAVTSDKWKVMSLFLSLVTYHWSLPSVLAVPLSLAATSGIVVTFFSSRY